MDYLSKSKINFFYYVNFYLTDRTDLKQFIERLFKKEKKKINYINYIFCNDNQIIKINNRFLNHNYYTDIITFNLADKSEPISAEIYISIDRVRDNAKNLEIPFVAEIHRVMFHGALHLCGYNDKTKSDILKIRMKEDNYLKLYFKK